MRPTAPRREPRFAARIGCAVEQTLKIHRDFDQLLAELAGYRLPDGSITQDSVVALGLAVSYAQRAHADAAPGINRQLFHELNFGTASPPS